MRKGKESKVGQFLRTFFMVDHTKEVGEERARKPCNSGVITYSATCETLKLEGKFRRTSRVFGSECLDD